MIASQRQHIIEHCLAFPGAYEDYPFDEIIDAGAWTVMRHRTNKKGFAHIFERGGSVCVNLKCEPLRADFLRQAYKGVTPAYHMNKEHWNTVVPGGDVPDEELRRLIAHSYDLTKPKPKRTKNARLIEIYDRLLSRYGDPHWWPAETPYEVIVGAVLTQNTAWGNVEKAIANFGELSPERVMAMAHGELAGVVRPAGFFNQKARYLQTVTHWYAQYGFSADAIHKLPHDRVRSELLSLKGVGRETADSIMLYAFGFPSFVVDAYTMRLVRRLPLPAGNNYEAVKAFFTQNLDCDAELFNRYHALIVLNGNRHCRKEPKCGGCPILELCRTGKAQTKDENNRAQKL